MVDTNARNITIVAGMSLAAIGLGIWACYSQSSSTKKARHVKCKRRSSESEEEEYEIQPKKNIYERKATGFSKKKKHIRQPEEEKEEQ